MLLSDAIRKLNIISLSEPLGIVARPTINMAWSRRAKESS
jgi:hypothetical protein